ncbi:type IV secretion system DNA-binding domain-containing protein [Novosphingobium subterraneum]|uniref:type IV secretion system DNA-binding domain-containing protein n=1 Tax=Novosphingobium subterraneum TaxID=48936 RepID=UPI003D0040A0
MSCPDTWSDRARPGKLQHHSARGNMPRNAGDFTRGSQLITHEFMMWFASAKMPLLVWFFTFCIALSIVLALLLESQEIQMILMRVYASGWTFMEFSHAKILNLTLPSGEVVQAPVGMVASHPDVIIAWNKLLRAIWGSLFISLFVAVPIAVWFVDYSKRRGKSILEERHQRGAMLVDAAELAEVINAHNRDMLGAEIAERLPGKSFDEVMKMSLATRKEAGIHHVYSIAGVPFPWRTEQAHTIMIGSTGTGKTTQMRALIAQMRARRDRAVVFDLTGAYVEAFYNPQTDIILNPMDERCPSWSVFAEATNHADFTGIAAALLPADGGGAEPFWMLAARTLFVETCIKLIKLGEATNQALASRLMMAELKEVHKLLEHTVADPLTAPEAAKMAESIRAVFNTNAQALRFLPEGNERFSISDWIRAGNKPGSILFITSSHNELVLNRALLSLWMNLAVHTLMRLPRTRDLRTWFFFDEVHALHRLPAIEDGLQTARGFGGAFVLGIHSFAKLAETYGKEGAQNLASLARTKLVLAAADRDTAEHCSDYIGHREVRLMDEAYSYGYSNIRDAATITPRSEVQPLVLPDDIMKLPSLRGFLVFPEGFDAARIKLTYKDYPKVAEGYVLRAHVEPIEFARDADDDAEGQTGGRENKDELELAPAPAIDDEPAKPQPALRQEELNFAAAQTEATPAPQSSLGRSMIASAEIVKSAATTRARETETAPKTSRSAGPTVPAQRSTRAARELAEAIDRDVSAEREKEASRQPEIDAPTPDDGMEM